MSDVADIQGLLQRTYGDYIDPLPADNTIADFAEFISATLQPGDTYNFPLRASLEHGVTFNNDGTAFAIGSVVDATVVNAQLDGSETLIAGNIPYATQAKMKNGDASYQDSVDFKIGGLMESGEFYRELSLLWGAGTGSTIVADIGVVNASISGANLGATQVLNITAATWIPALWNNAKNMEVDIYETDGTTIRESSVIVSNVDTSLNRGSFTKAASANTVVSGDRIVMRGAKDKQCFGLQGILANTGTLFTVSAASNPFWKAVSKAAGGALSIAEVRQTMANLHNNGLSDGGTLFVSSATFEDFVAELEAGERWNDEANSRPKRVGTNNIEILSSAGLVKISIHMYMKQGLAMFLPMGKVKRVGATDLTFSLPGTNEWFYVELPGNAGGQMRIYSHQAIVIECPYHAALFTGITNNADTSPA